MCYLLFSFLLDRQGNRRGIMQHLNYQSMKAIVSSKLKGHMCGTNLIDVRETEEVKASGTIPLSINVPLGVLEKALEREQEYFLQHFDAPKPPPGDTLIVFCKAGSRAAKASDVAVHCGYKRTKFYPGGWDEWSKYSKE
ncbi:Rhodanese-like domain [Trypanosoma melophagium]|uniref:Rhodanese-like domain n=1 Tax=Trypanosoma melophagium TaxID=715481 RepID=UPI00351A304D|nr:Rhodanese-like domain [Trypanosoma melophagium]